MLQAVLANLLILRELHSGNKTRKTPRPEITTSENNSKLFLQSIVKEDRSLDRIMWEGRFSSDPLCFILWSVFSNKRETLCASIMTQLIIQVFILTSLDSFAQYSVLSNLRIIFCFYVNQTFHPAMLAQRLRTGVMFYRTKKNESEALLLQAWNANECRNFQQGSKHFAINVFCTD